MSAKKLCAMLLTKGLKSLTDDEEEYVVDYLAEKGIDVDLDISQRDLCQMLLEKVMEEEHKKGIPLSAYANEILRKEGILTEKKAAVKKEEDIKEKRSKIERTLENKFHQLRGCVKSNQEYFKKTLYNLVIDPDFGTIRLSDGTSQYTAVVSIPENLYLSIFQDVSEPVLEITSSKGNKAYARIVSYHSESPNTVYISPLTGFILDIGANGSGFVNVCKSLPQISKVKFTFYGTQSQLENILPQLIEKLPSVINAFSYLSLGMILLTDVNQKEVKVRVDELIDSEGKLIFAGLIPFGYGDIPFEIDPDM